MLDLLQSVVNHGHRNRELLLTRTKVWILAKRERPEDVKIWLHEALKDIAEKAGWIEHENLKRRLGELTEERRRMADWERRRRYGGRDKSFKVFMEHVVAHKCGWLMEDWVWWLVISVDAGEFLSWWEVKICGGGGMKVIGGGSETRGGEVSLFQ